MTGPRRVLLLAGSTEATQVVGALAGRADVELTVSFAGRTANRARTPHGVAERVGGFGGIDGLCRYLERESIDAVIDATHPFAQQMPRHARAACQALGVAVVHVERPAWVEQAGDRWIIAADIAEAARWVQRSAARRVLLTIGRQELAPFAACDGARLIARCIDPPGPGVLDGAEILLARGPFTLAEEMALLSDRGVEVVVSKNSGGAATYAKVEAARSLQIPIVMVARPPATGATVVASATAAVEWLGRDGTVGPT